MNPSCRMPSEGASPRDALMVSCRPQRMASRQMEEGSLLATFRGPAPNQQIQASLRDASAVPTGLRGLKSTAIFLAPLGGALGVTSGLGLLELCFLAITLLLAGCKVGPDY